MNKPEAFDSVTREIIKNYLSSAADTMAVTVVRTARSAVVKDGMDFSTAIFTAEGDQVAQGLTLPFHMGAMQPALKAVIDYFGKDIKDGDIFANNDPYEGASHLPDIFLFKPIFYNNILVAWTCVIAHHTDIGGRVAGGNACDNTEIYQEGLRIPPIKLIEQGSINNAVWRILQKNVRVPDMVIGDVLAQISALKQGERDVIHLIDEYGIENMKVYMTDIIDYTERLTRAEIKALPDGSWDFTDYIDDDGISTDPIAIKAKVTIKNDELHVDFTGTSPQAKGSINPTLPFTKAAVYTVFKNLTNPDITANTGFFRPIKVTAPPGCYVNAQHPAPVAARGLGGFRVAHTVFGAMAKALPNKVPGAWGGGEVAVSFGGYYPNGKAFVFVEFNNDGPRGGGPHVDGADGAAAPVTNQANTPIESIEANYPLQINRYGFIKNTEGAGEYRGGMGIVREFQLLHEEATLQIRSDRSKFLPWGNQGGHPGTRNFNILNPSSDNTLLPSKFLKTLKKDEVYRLIQSGGGGYGNPINRNPKSVLKDFLEEKITSKRAKDIYGVVINKNKINTNATKLLRDKLKKNIKKTKLTPEATPVVGNSKPPLFN
ncbi:MAG: hypothetical protein CL766_06565 [Chloroflexi bacterium]|nr:hypothetical protein [Chloroflexota bacterium]